MSWDGDPGVEILEEFAEAQARHQQPATMAWAAGVVAARRAAVERYRARLSPAEKKERERARWERRKAVPGFLASERLRAVLRKEARRLLDTPSSKVGRTS